jgi:hypothetical protein
VGVSVAAPYTPGRTCSARQSLLGLERDRHPEYVLRAPSCTGNMQAMREPLSGPRPLTMATPTCCDLLCVLAQRNESATRVPPTSLVDSTSRRSAILAQPERLTRRPEAIPVLGRPLLHLAWPIAMRTYFLVRVCSTALTVNGCMRVDVCIPVGRGIGVESCGRTWVGRGIS